MNINYEINDPYQNPGVARRKNNTMRPIAKKNRSLQYYKFLFNSLKVEISINEFIGLTKMSNQGEIIIWIISLSLYYMGKREYPQVWLNIFHVFRAILGILVLNKLPRSYELIELISQDEKIMEMKNYNDIIRVTFKNHIMPRLKTMKIILLMYFSLTFLNLIIDLIDFIYLISILGNVEDVFRMITFSFVVINFLYLAVDLSYIFWTNSLKYAFSQDLIHPITNAFSGMILDIKSIMKLRKTASNNKDNDKAAIILLNNDEIISKSNKFPKEQVLVTEVDIKYKNRSVKSNHDYDTIQIDIDQNNNNLFINNLNRTNELTNVNLINKINL